MASSNAGAGVSSMVALILLLLIGVGDGFLLIFPRQRVVKLASSRSHDVSRFGVAITSSSPLFGSTTPVDGDEVARTKSKKKGGEEPDYDRRRQMWLDRYGSLEALQKTFGSPEDSPSLSPEATRRLYHTLLPRSLLALHEMGLMHADELAPLAYEARMAAKEYARSRCVWYARAATEAFDYFRAKRRRKGTNRKETKSGMSWDEIWSKYEAQIVQEECDKWLRKYREKDPEKAEKKAKKKLEKFREEGDLAMSIYLRILERSCVTNAAFDEMFLDNEVDDEDEQALLDRMANQLDHDVREILLPPKDQERIEKERQRVENSEAKAKEKLEKERAKARYKEEKRRQKEQERMLKAERKRQKERKELEQNENVGTMNEVDTVEEEGAASSPIAAAAASATTEVQALRVLAGTRRKFRRLLSSGRL